MEYAGYISHHRGWVRLRMVWLLIYLNLLIVSIRAQLLAEQAASNEVALPGSNNEDLSVFTRDEFRDALAQSIQNVLHANQAIPRLTDSSADPNSSALISQTSLQNSLASLQDLLATTPYNTQVNKEKLQQELWNMIQANNYQAVDLLLKAGLHALAVRKSLPNGRINNALALSSHLGYEEISRLLLSTEIFGLIQGHDVSLTNPDYSDYVKGYLSYEHRLHRMQPGAEMANLVAEALIKYPDHFTFLRYNFRCLRAMKQLSALRDELIELDKKYFAYPSWIIATVEFRLAIKDHKGVELSIEKMADINRDGWQAALRAYGADMRSLLASNQYDFATPLLELLVTPTRIVLDLFFYSLMFGAVVITIKFILSDQRDYSFKSQSKSKPVYKPRALTKREQSAKTRVSHKAKVSDAKPNQLQLPNLNSILDTIRQFQKSCEGYSHKLDKIIESNDFSADDKSLAGSVKEKLTQLDQLAKSNVDTPSEATSQDQHERQFILLQRQLTSDPVQHLLIKSELTIRRQPFPARFQVTVPGMHTDQASNELILTQELLIEAWLWLCNIHRMDKQIGFAAVDNNGYWNLTVTVPRQAMMSDVPVDVFQRLETRVKEIYLQQLKGKLEHRQETDIQRVLNEVAQNSRELQLRLTALQTTIDNEHRSAIDSNLKRNGHVNKHANKIHSLMERITITIADLNELTRVHRRLSEVFGGRVRVNLASLFDEVDGLRTQAEKYRLDVEKVERQYRSCNPFTIEIDIELESSDIRRELLSEAERRCCYGSEAITCRAEFQPPRVRLQITVTSIGELHRLPEPDIIVTDFISAVQTAIQTHTVDTLTNLLSAKRQLILKQLIELNCQTGPISKDTIYLLTDSLMVMTVVCFTLVNHGKCPNEFALKLNALRLSLNYRVSSHDSEQQDITLYSFLMDVANVLKLIKFDKLTSTDTRSLDPLIHKFKPPAQNGFSHCQDTEVLRTNLVEALSYLLNKKAYEDPRNDQFYAQISGCLAAIGRDTRQICEASLKRYSHGFGAALSDLDSLPLSELIRYCIPYNISLGHDLPAEELPQPKSLPPVQFFANNALTSQLFNAICNKLSAPGAIAELFNSLTPKYANLPFYPSLDRPSY